MHFRVNGFSFSRSHCYILFLMFFSRTFVVVVFLFCPREMRAVTKDSSNAGVTCVTNVQMNPRFY